MTKFIYLASIQTSINLAQVSRIVKCRDGVLIYMASGFVERVTDERDIDNMFEYIELLEAAARFERLITPNEQ